MPKYTQGISNFLEFIWSTIFSSLIIAVASTIASSFIRFYRIKDSAIQALTSLAIISSVILSPLWLANI